MSDQALPPAPSTSGLFSFTESLGYDPNALVRVTQQIAHKPAMALETLADVRHACDVLERHAVIRLRRQNRSWEYIGQRLGMSKQAARKRHPDVD